MRTNFKVLLIASILTSAICTLSGMHRPWPTVTGLFFGVLAGGMFRKTGKLALMQATDKNARLREELEAQRINQAALRSEIQASRARRDLLHGNREA